MLPQILFSACFPHVKFICIALGFCDIRLCRKYGSRLGHASLAACTACSARCVRESKSSRLLRPKHANANSFALLSASAYICIQNNQVFVMKMKSLFFVLFAVFMSLPEVVEARNSDSIPARPGRGWAMGLSAGYAYNMLSMPDAYDYDRHYMAGDGFSVSVPVRYGFNDWFALSAELSAVSKNYYSYRMIPQTAYPQEWVDNYYLSVPVYARFSFGGERLRGFVSAGVYAGAWLYSHREGYSLGVADNTLYPYDEAVPFDRRRDNRFEAGLLAGAGLEYKVSRHVGVFVEARYLYGLTDMQKQYIGQIPRYNNTWIVQAGAVFLF